MKRKYFFIPVLILLFAVRGNAQKYDKPFENAFGATWDVEIPSNNPFVSATSFEGFKLEYRHGLAHHMSVGLVMGWNRYYQYVPRQTYQIPDGAVTTDLYTYIYTLPFGINAHYYFGESKMFKPFLGLTLGANYSQQRIYYNTYYSEDENWGFLARPELGVMIEPTPHAGFGILAGVSYSYATNSQDVFKINGLKSLGFQLGVFFIQ